MYVCMFFYSDLVTVDKCRDAVEDKWSETVFAEFWTSRTCSGLREDKFASHEFFRAVVERIANWFHDLVHDEHWQFDERKLEMDSLLSDWRHRV